MGACLNPRIGSVDLKMWAEVRIPWVIVFSLAVSGGCHQYEQYGYVTPVRPFLKTCVPDPIFSAKGEECIPQTWDMYHEKWVVILMLVYLIDIFLDGASWSSSGTLLAFPSYVTPIMF
jgi:Ergosterol biosynthesis ERG4/ERG24 family